MGVLLIFSNRKDGSYGRSQSERQLKSQTKKVTLEKTKVKSLHDDFVFKLNCGFLVSKLRYLPGLPILDW